MVAHRITAPAVAHFGAGDIAWLTDTIKYALLDSGYTPNYSTDEFFNAISGNEITGTGYTAGGVTLANKSLVTVNASAVAPWQANTAYEVGDIVRPTTSDGHIYIVTTAGTSGLSEPTWDTTFGEDTADGTITWSQTGDSYLEFDADDPSWGPGATITARYGVAYVDGATPGTDDYIVAIGDFEIDVGVTDGTYEVVFHNTGILRNFRS